MPSLGGGPVGQGDTTASLRRMLAASAGVALAAHVAASALRARPQSLSRTGVQRRQGEEFAAGTIGQCDVCRAIPVLVGIGIAGAMLTRRPRALFGRAAR